MQVKEDPTQTGLNITYGIFYLVDLRSTKSGFTSGRLILQCAGLSMVSRLPISVFFCRVLAISQGKFLRGLGMTTSSHQGCVLPCNI